MHWLPNAFVNYLVAEDAAWRADALDLASQFQASMLRAYPAMLDPDKEMKELAETVSKHLRRPRPGELVRMSDG